MNARQLYQAGRLDDAIEALGAEVRDNPTDAQRRAFLFELLCFAGQYDRAEKQLGVLGRGGRDAELGTLLYHAALHGERLRQDMFEKQNFPSSVAKVVGGTINGTPFTTITDYHAVSGVTSDHIYTYGPLSALVDAASEEFMLYGSGVFPASDCGTTPDHAMLLVGYYETSSPAYWILKNSWNAYWGMSGYMTLQKTVSNPDGACGVRMFVTRVVL